MGWNGPSCENQAQGKLDLNLTQRNLEIHPKGDGGFSCFHQNYSSLGLVCNEQWRFCHNCVINRNMICIINDVKQKLVQHPQFFKHKSGERRMLTMMQSGDAFALRRKGKKKRSLKSALLICCHRVSRTCLSLRFQNIFELWVSVSLAPALCAALDCVC